MPDNNQPQPVQAAQEKKEGQPTTLETIAEEASDALRKVGYSALAVGGTAAATIPFGWDGFFIPAGFIGGGFLEDSLSKEPKGFTSKDAAKEAGAGLAFAPAVWSTLKTIELNSIKQFGSNVVNVLSYPISQAGLVAGALTFASIPVLNAIYYPIKHIFDKGTFKGIGEYFRENYWKGTKRSLFYLGLPSAAVVGLATANLIAPYLLFPIYAGLEVAFRLALSDKELNYWKLLNPITYVPNFLKPHYLISGAVNAGSKVYNRAASLAYGTGYSLRNFFSELVKSTPTPSPAPAPA